MKMSIINHIYGALDDYMEETNTTTKKLLVKRFDDMEILTQLLYEGIKRESYVFSNKDDIEQSEHISTAVNIMDIIKGLIREYNNEYQKGKIILSFENALSTMSNAFYELSHNGGENDE